MHILDRPAPVRPAESDQRQRSASGGNGSNRRATAATEEKWLEVLGCRVTEQEILKRSGKTNNVAWAFGLGLECLAMVLFDIPDIRLFWSSDERFTSQVQLIDNFTNKKGMTSHCYRIAYRSMERSLTDDEINELQWNVREQVQNKLNVVLRLEMNEFGNLHSKSFFVDITRHIHHSVVVLFVDITKHVF
ncbi:unnamed protein product [Camellia sinensis]